MAPFSVQGKTAIVTGGGSGINLAFTSLLLSKGCNVVIADLGLRPEAQKVVDEHSQKTNGKPRAFFVKTDVREWPALSRMFEVALEQFGDVDIVCPGAGLFEPLWTNFWVPPGHELSKDSPDGGRYAMMDINVTHPIRTTQLALSQFLHPQKGTKASLENPKRVVLISSIAGQLAGTITPMYFASKHAISGFIYSLGELEGRYGIRVNGVAPGVVMTPLFLEQPDKMKFVVESAKQSKADPSKQRPVTAEEVAQALLSCIEEDEIKGGKVLEVGTHRGEHYTREVAMVSDPGPPYLSESDLSGEAVLADVYERLEEDGWGRVK